MQVQTELRPPFHYSPTPTIICSAILICGLIILLLLMRKKPIKQVVKTLKKKDLSELKKEYLDKIGTLKSDVTSNKITSRRAYQILSGLIRGFIFEATNIRVQYYTLQQIETLKMASLTELIREYYNPEFAAKSNGNIAKSIEKTAEVIKKWT